MCLLSMTALYMKRKVRLGFVLVSSFMWLSLCVVLHLPSQCKGIVSTSCRVSVVFCQEKGKFDFCLHPRVLFTLKIWISLPALFLFCDVTQNLRCLRAFLGVGSEVVSHGKLLLRSVGVTLRSGILSERRGHLVQVLLKVVIWNRWQLSCSHCFCYNNLGSGWCSEKKNLWKFQEVLVCCLKSLEERHLFLVFLIFLRYLLQKQLLG